MYLYFRKYVGLLHQLCFLMVTWLHFCYRTLICCTCGHGEYVYQVPLLKGKRFARESSCVATVLPPRNRIDITFCIAFMQTETYFKALRWHFIIGQEVALLPCIDMLLTYTKKTCTPSFIFLKATDSQIHHVILFLLHSMVADLYNILHTCAM